MDDMNRECNGVQVQSVKIPEIRPPTNDYQLQHSLLHVHHLHLPYIHAC